MMEERVRRQPSRLHLVIHVAIMLQSLGLFVVLVLFQPVFEIAERRFLSDQLSRSLRLPVLIDEHDGDRMMAALILAAMDSSVGARDPGPTRPSCDAALEFDCQQCEFVDEVLPPDFELPHVIGEIESAAERLSGVESQLSRVPVQCSAAVRDHLQFQRRMLIAIRQFSCALMGFRHPSVGEFSRDHPNSETDEALVPEPDRTGTTTGDSWNAVLDLTVRCEVAFESLIHSAHESEARCRRAGFEVDFLPKPTWECHFRQEMMRARALSASRALPRETTCSDCRKCEHASWHIACD